MLRHSILFKSKNCYLDPTSSRGPRRTRMVLALWMLTASLATHGAESWHQSAIQQVYPLSDGSFVLILLTDAATCSSASSPDYYVVAPGQNGVTADGIKLLFAASLAAAAQGNPVTIAFDNATTNCYVNRLVVSYS